MAILEKKKTEKAESKAVAKPAIVMSAGMQSVLVQPRISEKASKLSTSGKYVFVVAGKANKVEVKKAVEATYKVKVIQVNIINNRGKSRNFGRASGKTQSFKKAIVTLKKGETIEGMTETV